MDSLEKFFRDRASQNEIKFHEADWDKLESKLDSEMPVTYFPWTWLKKYWWVPTMILFFPVAWLTIDRFGNDIAGNGTENANQPTETLAERMDIEKDFVPFSSKSDISAENVSPNGNMKSSQIRKADTASSSRENVQGSIHSNEKNKVKTTEDRGYVVLENGVRSSADSRMAELHFLSSLSPEFQINGMSLAELDPTDVSEELPSGLVKKASKNHGMTVHLGLGYSPDFSTVGLGDFTSPGTRWKAMVEVGITSKLLLHTGITKVHNKYTANGEEYHAPYGYWKNGVVADETYGTCDMIDVPLNLRYTFMIKNRHQLFISGGASTYFLTKEAYRFDYTQNDPYLPQEWSTDNMSVYPFGIINISMGYQYSIGKKGAFQIEPFIKIPTSGIGWGEVDLHTIGAYFMYKYRIGK